MYQPLNKKKGNKKRSQIVENGESVDKAIQNAQTKFFDEVAKTIGNVTIPQLSTIAEKLRDLASQWSDWATKEAFGVFVSSAVKAARASLNPLPTNDGVF